MRKLERPSAARLAGRPFRLAATALAVASFAILGACTVGPDYAPPQSPAVVAFDHARGPAFTAAAPEEAWWRALGDERLSQLVERALAENHDLRIAQANVEAARAFLRQDRLDAFPVVTTQGSVLRQRASEAVPTGGLDRTETFYDAGFDAVWELDFFGRVRRTVEASAAEHEAALAEQRDVAVTVAAEVVRTYVELRGAQHRLEVARRNATNQQQTFELTRVLLDAGRGTELDTARAQAQLETTLALVEPLEAAAARAVHRLGVLVGRPPGELAEQLSAAEPLPALPEELAIGDPAGLLRRRADVRAAERRLAAATARIGVATADLFPRVSLLGSAGFLSTSTGSFGDGSSERASIGPFLNWPAFDLGRVRARIRAADAGAEANLASYERAVLGALEEAENSLVGYSRATARRERLRVAAEASERAVELARLRHRSGVDSFLSVLDAERRALEAQDLLAQTEIDSALAFVALYKALGGGWEQATAPAGAVARQEGAPELTASEG